MNRVLVRPMRAYKFVSLDIADSFQSGCLKIGTFANYRKMEGDRADPFEAVSGISVNGDFTAGSNDAIALEKATSFNISPGGRVIITNCLFASYINNMYCFCMSRSLTSAPKTVHAAFEITAVRSLAKSLKHYADILGDRYIIGRMTYREKLVEFGQLEQPDPSPFEKDPYFSWEREVRIVWPSPVRPRPVQTYLVGSDQGISPFITDPDIGISQFLKRLY